ncbi:MAG: hypothetical protein KGJ23_08410 [Euryarchaeota archaeon]|nr:hypothetical protein [Euryarchaeota archaeon]MDE1836625.1 hypothetical protein [Euryarchaeota archaeon]MDE1879180.1 hypothetical protein [Euryarchaeota archaeon]MDE2044595.1 hypothetical protein [Thermoplasmata archaeon]
MPFNRKTAWQLLVKGAVYRPFAIALEVLATYLWFHGSLTFTLLFAPVILITNFMRFVGYVLYDFVWANLVQTRWHLKQRGLHRLHLNGNGNGNPAPQAQPAPTPLEELEKEVESLFTQPPTSGEPGT